MLFLEKLEKTAKKNDSLVCVGLDSDFSKLPQFLLKENNPQFEFNRAIIDKTHDLVRSYKLNSAFYEARGEAGIKELKKTCDYVKKTYPEIPLILDAKRADIGNTNNGYIQFIFDYLGVDAVTLHPYLGREALRPFLDSKNKGCIILCRTSNPGAGELQDLSVQSQSHLTGAIPLYLYLAKKVSQEWNNNNNCLLVIGATYPKEMKEIRKIVGDMTFLVPGIGTQGGDVEKTVKAGLNSQKMGLIIHCARSIIFASSDHDFADRARIETEKIKDNINRFR